MRMIGDGVKDDDIELLSHVRGSENPQSMLHPVAWDRSRVTSGDVLSSDGNRTIVRT